MKELGALEDLVEDSFYDIDAHCIADLFADLGERRSRRELSWIHSLRSEHFLECKASAFVCDPMTIVATSSNTRRV